MEVRHAGCDVGIARRPLAVVERELTVMRGSVIPATCSWESVAGMCEETEFTRVWIAKMEAEREEYRRAARAGDGE